VQVLAATLNEVDEARDRAAHRGIQATGVKARGGEPCRRSIWRRAGSWDVPMAPLASPRKC